MLSSRNTLFALGFILLITALAFRQEPLGASLAGLLAGFLGLWFSRKSLLEYFPDRNTAIALILLALGTNFLNFAAVDNSQIYIYLFLLYALLVDQCIQWEKEPSTSRALILGLIIGLMVLIRPSDLLALLLPLFWGWKILDPSFRKAHLNTLAWGLLPLLGFLILRYIWNDSLVEMLSAPDYEGLYSWFAPSLIDHFFSYRKGWLVYTPMMVFALLGFLALRQKSKALFWLFLLFFFLFSWLAASPDLYWKGDSLGQGSMVPLYALLLFPLAALVGVFQKNSGRKKFGAIAAALLILLNLFQTWQSKGHGLDPENMTKAYYWRIFAHPVPDARDAFLIDTDEDYPGARKDVTELAFHDFEEMPNSTKAQMVNGTQAFSPAISVPLKRNDFDWFRVSARFYTPDREGELYLMPQFNVQLYIQDHLIKHKMIRVNRVLKEGEWTEVWMDVKLPSYTTDEMKIYLWNANSQKPFYMDDLKVEGFKEG